MRKCANHRRTLAFAAMLLAVSLGSSEPVLAHCDTLDGPVVAAARKALDSGNVDEARERLQALLVRATFKTVR